MARAGEAATPAQKPSWGRAARPARARDLVALLPPLLPLLLLAATLCCGVSAESPGPATRILLYGDSHTEGVTLPGGCVYPYAYELARLTGCPVSYSGHPGANSVALADEPLKALLAHMSNQSASPYTLAVVLVGTNDLRDLCTDGKEGSDDPCTSKKEGEEGGGVTVERLAERISAIHASIMVVGRSYSSAFATYALAVPPPHQESFDPPFRRENRERVNSLLANWASGSAVHHFIDSDGLLPRFLSKTMERHRYVDLHFTPHGYNELANVIGDALIQRNVTMCPLFEHGTATVPLRVTRLASEKARPLCA